jgi:CBS-domain-containing membrane protein
MTVTVTILTIERGWVSCGSQVCLRRLEAGSISGTKSGKETPMAKDDTNSGDAEITKRILVREAMEKVGGDGCVVSESEGLIAVSEKLAATPGVHTVAVVDGRVCLVGVIPMRLLMNELFLDVAPEDFLVGMRGIEDVEEFARISRAKTAGELMEEAAYVTMDDTVREAFSRMRERKLEGLPIVDEGMKVLGYLDFLQLLRLWLSRHGKGEA